MAKTKKTADALLDIFTPKGKTPRMSAAEAVERGYFHPIGGGLKLSRPVSEMQAEHLPTEGIKMTPERLFNPEKMVGSASIPLVGDNALGGTDLVALKGSPLSAPVTLQAGRSFPRQNLGEAWASHQGIISGLDSKVDQALMEGAQDVYGAHVSMSPTAVDYNTMVTEAMLRQFDPLDLTKKTAKEFDTAVRNFGIKDKTTGEMKYPARGFVGLRDPELEAQLLSQEGGPLRKIFLDRAQMRQFQLQGLPDVAASRFGISDPIMLDLPLGTTGLDIVKFPESGRILSSSPNPHKTYSTHMAGDYVGGLESPVSYKDYFQDFFDARRLLGNKPSEENYAFMRSTPIQHHDQEWLDRLMKAIEARKNIIKTGEYADGGMVETPTQEAIANTVQNPNAARMLEMDLANLALMNRPQQMANGGAVNMQDGGLLQNAFRAFVPAQVRTFVGSLAGDESPITEKNFSGDELAQMRKAIMSSRQDRTAMNARLHHEAMQNAATAKERRELFNRGPSKELDQTVGYQHYPGSPTDLASDFSLSSDAAIRNTLGRFAYQKTPEGNLVATDLYKFRDDQSDKTRPTSDYANMGTAAKLLALAKDSFGDAGFQTLLSRTGNAFLGNKSGRPVTVNLGKAPFAGGGSVKQPSPEEMLIEMMERGYGKN
jgi:hypothetical protein